MTNVGGAGDPRASHASENSIATGDNVVHERRAVQVCGAVGYSSGRLRRSSVVGGVYCGVAGK